MEFLRPELSYLITISEAGSISRAADRLKLRQSTLSKSMQRLERSVGGTLLVRHAGGVRLTPMGQKLLAGIQGLRSEWNRTQSEAALAASEVSGRLILGAHPIVSRQMFPRFLPRLMVAHPRMEISLISGTSLSILEAVRDFRADFGFLANPPRYPDLVLLPLLKQKVGFWRAPGARPKPLQDLASGKAVVLYHPQLIGGDALLAGLEAKGLRPARLFAMEDYETCTALAREGAGVALTPEGPASGLVDADPKAPSLVATLFLAYRADAQRGPAARALIEAVRAAYPTAK